MNTRLDQIRGNPTFYAKVLDPAEFGSSFKWHGHAYSPRSSQVFCVSAFGVLQKLASKDRIIAALLSQAFPEVATRGRPRSWAISLEHEDEFLLGERGTNQPTSIDVLCTSSKEVVCIESKFVTDAREGFGGCSQASRGRCGGYYGPGSDLKTGTPAWCRLENWDGHRSPRLYWALGKAHFKAEVFAPQQSGDERPLAGSNYQLMRNFLFAAAMAERERKRFFGMLALCPAATSGLIEGQIDSFRQDIVRPEYRNRVGFLTYETYIAHLHAVQDRDAEDLAGFLEDRIKTLCG